MKFVRKNLIDLTYYRTAGINKIIVIEVINNFLSEMHKILSKDDEVEIELRGFGTFKKKKRNSVFIQNPKTKEKKLYSDLYSIKFKLSKKSIIYKEDCSNEQI